MRQPLAFEPKDAPENMAAYEVVNLIDALEAFPSASLSWEQEPNDQGEVRGTWHFDVQACKHYISVASPYFKRALWSAVRSAELADDETYLAQKKAYADAMAKLTLEERRVLGLV